jgi:crotonobetainyl-CoA:carnitine CoA-transferase CaiB-like acyl-CoA transferase
LAGPLEGIKVLELGHWVAVPSACAILSDWGAEVIKIEDPQGGDAIRGYTVIEGVKVGQINWYWELLNRNKRSIAINLKKERGREVAYKLIQRMDVFVSNFMPQALEDLRMDYETLSRLNPGLIYASLTGYGELGPDRDRPGYDYSAFWARSGIMNMLGEPDSPPPSQRPGMGDQVTSMLVAGAISAALLARQRTGRGQEVEFSLYHTAVWVLGRDVQTALFTGMDIHRTSRKEAKNPLWNTYQTKDGKWFQLVMIQSDRFWSNFCQAIGREDLINDPRYYSHEKREENHTSLVAIIEQALATKTASEWHKIFDEKGLIYGDARSISQVLADPQARENGFFTPIDHPTGTKLTLVNTPAKFKQTPASIKGPAPQLGQHTEEVLLELGYSWDDITELKNQNVIL